jgi:exodeoxyribonuclease VII large subunit
LQRHAHALMRASGVAVQARERRLDSLEDRLRALDPHQVLGRGYAWLTGPDGGVLQSVRQLAPGDAVSAQLADGRAALRVEDVTPPDTSP